MLNQKNKVVAVMVTYNPDPHLLLRSVESLSAQVFSVVIVDNGSSEDIHSLLSPSKHLIVIKNFKNLGVATGQNIGIQEAMKQGANFILLSDQDSVYPKQYVRKLLDSFFAIEDKNICAIGPRFLDLNKPQLNPIITPSKTFKKKFVTGGIHEVKLMISSGMLICSDAMSKIGLMKDNLFIDWVDCEWCWRAHDRGYSLYIDADISMNHKLGDGSLKLFFGKEITYRSPRRHYYMARNALYLALNSDSIGLIEKVMLFLLALKYLALFPIFLKPRGQNAKALAWAFYDALKSRLGPCQHALA